MRYLFPTISNSNIRRGISRKTDEIAAVLSSNSIDMAFFTESWATDEMDSGLFNIDGYVCHHRDRNDGRRGGGLLAYARSDMPCTRIPSLEHPDLETMWLLYRQPQMPRFVSHILFGCIYHPPDKNNWELSAHILQCLDEVVRKHPTLLEGGGGSWLVARGSWLVARGSWLRGSTRDIPVLKTYKRLFVHQTDERTDEYGRAYPGSNHEPRATSHEPRATSHEPRAASHEPRSNLKT